MFAVPNSLRSLIDERYSYLKKLVRDYPSLKDIWMDDMEKECRRLAAETSGEDSEIETDVYLQEIKRVDDSDDLMNLFYQSMLLMTYAYYEGIVRRIAKDVGAKQLIAAICKQKGFELSSEAEADSNFMHDEICVLRNNIIHNNSGMCNRSDKIRNLSKKYPEIDFTDDTISIYGPQIILDSLEKAHHVLIELTECRKSTISKA